MLRRSSLSERFGRGSLPDWNRLNAPAPSAPAWSVPAPSAPAPSAPASVAPSPPAPASAAPAPSLAIARFVCRPGSAPRARSPGLTGFRPVSAEAVPRRFQEKSIYARVRTPRPELCFQTGLHFEERTSRLAVGSIRRHPRHSRSGRCWVRSPRHPILRATACVARVTRATRVACVVCVTCVTFAGTNVCDKHPLRYDQEPVAKHARRPVIGAAEQVYALSSHLCGDCRPSYTELEFSGIGRNSTA